MVNYVNMVIMHNMLNMIKLSTWPCNMIFMVNKTLQLFNPPCRKIAISPELNLRWTSVGPQTSL